MRVLVCGGRHYANRQHVYNTLDAIHSETRITMLINGGASGADNLAYQWSWDRNIPGLTFNADWPLHGKSAGPIRNKQMLDEGKPDLVVAFPGGRGTQGMIALARAAGVPVREIQEPPVTL